MDTTMPGRVPESGGTPCAGAAEPAAMSAASASTPALAVDLDLAADQIAGGLVDGPRGVRVRARRVDLDGEAIGLTGRVAVACLDAQRVRSARPGDRRRALEFRPVLVRDDEPVHLCALEVQV